MSRKMLYQIPCILLIFICSEIAFAVTCATQAQMTDAQRNAIENSARSLSAQIQTANLQALQQNTLPSLAANFSGITGAIEHLKPLVAPATITVNNLYLLDASANPPAATPTDFYCGSPVVSFNFRSLPRGTYALAILHATGVPQPQQISLVMAQAPPNRWLLAGFFAKPMMSAGHDGLWYWKAARAYSQSKMNWAAWLYYQTASDLLNPLSFLSSPNLQELHREADQARPSNFPAAHPLVLTVQGVSYTVDAVATTTAFGALDLDVRYTPSAAQAAQLANPPIARQQVTQIMSALIELHPGLRQAFHGIWVHAQQGSTSLFALELPMETIAATPPPQAAESASSGE